MTEMTGEPTLLVDLPIFFSVRTFWPGNTFTKNVTSKLLCQKPFSMWYLK